jgi:hypothetical protein
MWQLEQAIDANIFRQADTDGVDEAFSQQLSLK